MSIRPARVCAIVVAVLASAFVIPWTHAHIAYPQDWKEQSTGEACAGRCYLTPYDKQRSMKLGTIPDGHPVYIDTSGKVSMGRQIGSFSLSVHDDNDHFDFLGGAEDLHLGDITTIEEVGTFTLREARSDIVWFTSSPGKAISCFGPDPTFMFRNFP